MEKMASLYAPEEGSDICAVPFRHEKMSKTWGTSGTFKAKTGVTPFWGLLPTVNFADDDHPLVPFVLVTQTRQK